MKCPRCPLWPEEYQELPPLSTRDVTTWVLQSHIPLGWVYSNRAQAGFEFQFFPRLCLTSGMLALRMGVLLASPPCVLTCGRAHTHTQTHSPSHSPGSWHTGRIFRAHFSKGMCSPQEGGSAAENVSTLSRAQPQGAAQGRTRQVITCYRTTRIAPVPSTGW